MSEQKRYQVTEPFWRNKRRYIPGNQNRGDIHLTDEEAAPLHNLGVISEEPIPSREEEAKAAQEKAKAEAAAGKDNTNASESGGSEEEKAGKDANAKDEEPDFVKAVRQLEVGNKDHWTNDGRPDVRALADMGFDCTAAERNELWEQYKALFDSEQ